MGMRGALGRGGAEGPPGARELDMSNCYESIIVWLVITNSGKYLFNR
jgi:hypothetical protein